MHPSANTIPIEWAVSYPNVFTLMLYGHSISFKLGGKGDSRYKRFTRRDKVKSEYTPLSIPRNIALNTYLSNIRQNVAHVQGGPKLNTSTNIQMIKLFLVRIMRILYGVFNFVLSCRQVNQIDPTNPKAKRPFYYIGVQRISNGRGGQLNGS